jgi:hypothetical protein
MKVFVKKRSWPILSKTPELLEGTEQIYKKKFGPDGGRL